MGFFGKDWRTQQTLTHICASFTFQMAAEEEIKVLRIQLREKEEQVHQAAQAGLDLLNQQVELQNRLDEQRVEMTNALEVRSYTNKEKKLQ